MVIGLGHYYIIISRFRQQPLLPSSINKERKHHDESEHWRNKLRYKNKKKLDDPNPVSTFKLRTQKIIFTFVSIPMQGLFSIEYYAFQNEKHRDHLNGSNTPPIYEFLRANYAFVLREAFLSTLHQDQVVMQDFIPSLRTKSMKFSWENTQESG